MKASKQQRNRPEKSGASDPAAVAAAAGRKKYGKHAFQEAAAHGHKMGKAEGEGSEGHYSNNADPGEPKAGKASKPGKCPECGHPTEATGQGDTLPRTKAQEDWQEDCGMEKYETTNSKKMGYKLSEAGKETRQPEKSDHAFEVEGEKEKKSSDDARLAQQKDPQHNAKEQAEGNNELAGTTPTQVGQDGKNKPGYDEMKGHLKLAKFIGMKHYKRTKALEGSQSQSGAEAQHKESEMDKAETGHEKGIHTQPMWEPKDSKGASLGKQPLAPQAPGRSFGSVKGGAGKEEHKRVLGEMKGMPKPKLPGQLWRRKSKRKWR